MIRDIRYILKRIIIGVGIALVLMLIRGNLISDVKALSSVESDYFVYTIPNSNDFYNKGGVYFSNFGYDSSMTSNDMAILKYYIGLSIGGNNNTSYLYDTSLKNIGSVYSIPGKPDTVSSYHLHAFDIFLNSPSLQGVTNLQKIEMDTEYSIALRFTKTASLTFPDWSWDDIISDTWEHYSITFNIKDLNTDTIYSVPDVSILSVEHTLSAGGDSSTSNPSMIFIIKFKFDSSEIILNTDNFIINDIDISLGRYGSAFRHSFITNPTSESHNFKLVEFAYIKGDIQTMSSFSEGGAGHYFGYSESEREELGLDVIHIDDMNKLDELEMCDSLDISCHIRNISTNIKNLFVRLGNSLTSFLSSLLNGLIKLFVPSSEYLESFISDNYTYFRNKLGFLIYPFELISTFLNRLLNIQRNSVLSFPGFKYPGTDIYLIPSFSYDFDSMLSDPSISSLYNYYSLIADGLLVFMFVNLCYKKYKSIVEEGR